MLPEGFLDVEKATSNETIGMWIFSHANVKKFFIFYLD